MEAALVKLPERSLIEKLSVVRNFRQAIEARDISLMKSELYAFLTLHCGFIAHYNINGFQAAYSSPKDFAGVFIRHFDRKDSYFCGVHNCDERPYRETGYTIAEIKQEFHRIADLHLDEIASWADSKQRTERLEAYKMLKKEFDGSPAGIEIHCGACGNEYQVTVLKEGEEFNDFGIVCCLFCGQQIKLY
jgi:hypothetical protein